MKMESQKQDTEYKLVAKQPAAAKPMKKQTPKPQIQKDTTAHQQEIKQKPVIPRVGHTSKLGKITLTLATKQSYIQSQLPDTKKKQLVVSFTAAKFPQHWDVACVCFQEIIARNLDFEQSNIIKEKALRCAAASS